MKKKGIVLYDFLLANGGAEAVFVDLMEGFGDFDGCVDFVNESFEQRSRLEERKMFILGKGTAIKGWQTIKGMYNFRTQTAFLSAYEAVIYSGSNSPVAIANHRTGLNVLYCHTVPRFAYDLKQYWLSRAKWWEYPLLLLLIKLVRMAYESAFYKMDIVIANSANVRERVKNCLGSDCLVIHPPCDIESFRWLGQEDYYLSTARVEPYKRVEMLVQAFMKMPDKRLIVASGGSDLERLKVIAGACPNIEFTGWVSKSQMVELIGKAIATLYVPMDEDFGISPVESMAAGKPVIGVAEGGMLETILPTETGLLIAKNFGVDDIAAAVRQMTPELALSLREACENRAACFSRGRFIQQMRQIIDCHEKRQF